MMKIVNYSYFLEHKDEKHSYKVEIVCKDCHKNTVISWHALCNRKQSVRHQQICTKCIQKYKTRKSLKGFYYDIRFDSFFELGFIHHCVTNNIFIERFSGKINYADENGKLRTYNPDFLVDNQYVIEIKGVDSVNVKLKASAAKDFFKNNFTYKMLFLDDLKKLSNYITCNQMKDLTLFNQDKLKITSYPESFNQNKRTIKLHWICI